MPHNYNPDEEYGAPSEKPDVPVLMKKVNANTNGNGSTEPQKKWHSVLTKSVIDDSTVREFAEAILATVAVLVAVIYWNQLQVMSHQLQEMQSGSIQTNALVITAAHQATELHNLTKSAKISADAARDAAAVSKEALHSAQRAFVTFTPAPEFDMLNLPTERTFTLSMPMENEGATLAHALRDRVSCVTPLGVIPDNYAFPDINGGNELKCGIPWAATGASVIPAKGRLLSQRVGIDGKMLEEFIQNNPGPLRAGAQDHPTRHIYFYGWVTYRDIFTNTPEHLTEFCRELSILIVTQSGIKHDWSYCTAHNCTDEDCPDYKERIKQANASPTWFNRGE
jgi:hypothetical protein